MVQTSTELTLKWLNTRRAFMSAAFATIIGTPLYAFADALLPGTAGFNPIFRNLRGLKMYRSLEQISDHFHIEDILTRYCYAVDDQNWDAYRELFTSDAVIDDTITGGIKSSVEEHIIYMKRALSKVLLSQHAISTVLVDLKGNQASVRAHCSCPMVLAMGEGKTHVFFQGLWYRNSFIRTSDGWKIRHLLEEGYWNQNMPPGFRF